MLTISEQNFTHKIEVSLVNVSREEQQELKDYLEENCWMWREDGGIL